jgi:hypothetical protein
MENQNKDKKKSNKKNVVHRKDKLETMINDDIKSIEKSNHFLKYLTENIKDFLKISEIYTNKIQNLLAKFSQEEMAKKKITITDEEIGISDLLKSIITLVIEKINNMIEFANKFLIKDIEKGNKLESILNTKKNDILDTYSKQIAEIAQLNSDYHIEFSKYEDYLVKKHLGIQNQNEEKKENNNNDKNNSNNNKKNTKEIEQVDNTDSDDNNKVSKTREIQDKIMKYAQDSNDNVKKDLNYFFNLKKTSQEKIYQLSKGFGDSLIQGFFNEQQYYEKLASFNDTLAKKMEFIDKMELEGYKPILLNLKPYSLKFFPNKNNEKLGMNINEVKFIDYEKLYDIIMEIKNNALMMSEENLIKFEEIQKILYINHVIDSFFDKNYGEKIDKDKENVKPKITETDEQKLYKMKNYFEMDEIYRSSFIRHLNNKRVNGNLRINRKASEILGDLLFNLSKNAIKDKDYPLFKIVSFLSVTYYFMENNKKIYICKYLNSFPEFSNKQFWIDYLKAIIDDEFQKNNISDRSISDFAYSELKNMKSKKIHITIYSNIISLTKSMVDFGLKKDFIIEWLELVVNNILYIEESEKKEIINIINEDQH